MLTLRGDTANERLHLEVSQSKCFRLEYSKIFCLESSDSPAA